MLAGWDPNVVEQWVELDIGLTWHSFFVGGAEQWGTAGIVWPDAEAASQGFAIHAEALLSQILGEEELAVSAVGDEAACYSYTSSMMFARRGALCLFRLGNATFLVPADGPGVEAVDVVQLARTIAARAAAMR